MAVNTQLRIFKINITNDIIPKHPCPLNPSIERVPTFRTAIQGCTLYLQSDVLFYSIDFGQNMRGLKII